MAKKTKVNANDATMYKVSENDALFAMAKTNDGIVILCGKFRVSSKTFKTFKDAEEYIKAKPYELLINVSVLFIKLNLQDENENNQPQIAANNKENEPNK